MVKLWDVGSDVGGAGAGAGAAAAAASAASTAPTMTAKPRGVLVKQLKAGELFSVRFLGDASSPFLLAAGGSAGIPALWDVSESDAVRQAFNSRAPAGFEFDVVGGEEDGREVEGEEEEGDGGGGGGGENDDEGKGDQMDEDREDATMKEKKEKKTKKKAKTKKKKTKKKSA